MRLGIFGGSFDPIHYGHLLLAESCREQCGLDEVWFVPAAVPPHKRNRELTASVKRVEMLQLALAGHEHFRVSTVEVGRGGVSFTVDTLSELRRQRPHDEFFLLMGADSLQDLATWRDPQRICELAIPVAVRRAGSPEPDFAVLAGLVDAGRRQAMEQHQVQMPLVDFSSSDIRSRVAAGRSIRYHTPRAVEKYIETDGLYLGNEE
jgi:nicotinate-nucleotide adenylyltransferase